MGIWVQHGWGKTDKLVRLHDEGLLDGVILSPASELPGALRATVDSLSGDSAPRILIDPQAFVYTIDEGFARYHGAHGIEPDAFRPGMDAAEITAYVRAVTAMNNAMTVHEVIAPSPRQASFDDRWFGLALTLARTTLASVDDGRPVFASVIIAEAALDDWPRVQDWLDEATAIDVDGFYFIVARSSSGPYPRVFRSERMTNLMRLVRRLANSEYQIIVGYSDVEGLLTLAAGGTGFATGWSNRLRSFAESSWVPQGGGAQPPRRIFSPATLTPFLDTQAQVLTGGAFDDIVPTDYRATVRAGTLSQEQAHMAYLVELANTAQVLQDQPDPASTLDTLDQLLEDAQSALVRVIPTIAGITGAYLDRLASIRTALHDYRNLERL